MGNDLDRVVRRQQALTDFAVFALRASGSDATAARAVDVATQLLSGRLGALVRFVAARRAELVHGYGRVQLAPGETFSLPPGLLTAPVVRGSLPPGLVVIPVPGQATAPDDGEHLRPESAEPSISVLVLVDDQPWGRLFVAGPGTTAAQDEDVETVRRIAILLGAALERDRPVSRDRAVRRAMAILAGSRGRPTEQATEVALLDQDGVIVWVNRAWEQFARDNGGDLARTGVGVSYLAHCDAAGDQGSADVATAIRAAVGGELPAPVAVTIPCDSPTRKRTYDVLVSSRLDDVGRCIGATVTLSPAES